MATKSNRFGDAFKVKEEDVFSQLDQGKTTIAETKKVETTSDVQEKRPPAFETEKPGKAAFKRVSFYITPEQHKEIKMLAAQSDDQENKDISAIVRNALTAYLKQQQ